MEDVSSVRSRSPVLTGILFLMVLYTLYFAASLIMPIVLAVLLSLALSPVVRLLGRVRLPQTFSALLVMLCVAALMVSGIYSVAAPATTWLEKAPQELGELEYKLAWVTEPVRKIDETSRQLREITGEGPSAGADERSESSFSLINELLTRTPDVIVGAGIMLVLLFFLLASGDEFLRKVVRIAPSLRDKRRVVEAAREIQQQVSLYLGTITFINAGVALAVTIAMYLLDMPNPILWGVLTGALNFIPYLGVAISIVIVGFVSALSFDSVGQILLPPLAIFAINVVEGQFLTPIITGRRLALSPVAIFITLVTLGWLWGLIGVLIAVPVIATVKLVCEQVEPLEGIAVLLGRD